MEGARYTRDASTIKLQDMKELVEMLGLSEQVQRVYGKTVDVDGNPKEKTTKKEYLRVLQRHFVLKTYGTQIPQMIRDSLVHRPMLATVTNQWSDLSQEAWQSGGWYAEEKVSGFRAGLGFNHGGSYAYSRFLSSTTFLPKRVMVPEVPDGLYGRLLLDVEVVSNDTVLRGIMDEMNFMTVESMQALDIYMGLEDDEQREILNAHPGLFEYVILDVLETSDRPDLHELGCYDRSLLRGSIVENLTGNGFRARTPRVAYGGNGTAGKRDLYNEIAEQGGEGIIMKRKNSLYIPGVRSKDWLKFKNLKSMDNDTLDAFILEWVGGDVALFGVYDISETEVIEMCEARIPGGPSVAKQGDVCELSRMEDGETWGVLRVRPHKRAESCIVESWLSESGKRG